MAINNYIAAFNHLVEELKEHPNVALLSYHTFSGLSSEGINSLEVRYNCQLDDTIRAFYMQTNGLQLRWMLKSNPHYHQQKYPDFQENTAPVAWDYAVESFEKEDACVFFLPLEEILRQLVVPDGTLAEIELDGVCYSNVEFYSNIRPVDLFSYYCNMALFFRQDRSPLVLMGDEQGTCFVDSRYTDFETYLNFIIASKGLCSRRKEFFGQADGYKTIMIKNISDNLVKQWSLDMLVLSQNFPLANQSGNAIDYINTAKMQQKAALNTPLLLDELKEIAEMHQHFLNSGGAGGTWTIIGLGERSLALYDSKQATAGKQAIFDLLRLENGVLKWSDWDLSYSSWCGVFAPKVDFRGLNLEGAIMIDSNFEQASFENTNLENVDFSRSNLQGANFENANLKGADFENCNLERANFKGALMDGSQFKGAKLDDVLI